MNFISGKLPLLVVPFDSCVKFKYYIDKKKSSERVKTTTLKFKGVLKHFFHFGLKYKYLLPSKLKKKKKFTFTKKKSEIN